MPIFRHRLPPDAWSNQRLNCATGFASKSARRSSFCRYSRLMSDKAIMHAHFITTAPPLSTITQSAEAGFQMELNGLLTIFHDPVPTMFSLQMLFGKADRFYQLLEDAASEAHESVRLVIGMIKAPDSAKNLDDLALTRRKEKKIGEQITAELV